MNAEYLGPTPDCARNDLHRLLGEEAKLHRVDALNLIAVLVLEAIPDDHSAALVLLGGHVPIPDS